MSLHKVFALALGHCWSEVLIEIYHKDFNVASWKDNELRKWLQHRAAFQSATLNISNAVKRNSNCLIFCIDLNETHALYSNCIEESCCWQVLKIYLLLCGHMRIAISDNLSLVLGASINKVRSQKISPDVASLIFASTYCQVLSLSNSYTL